MSPRWVKTRALAGAMKRYDKVRENSLLWFIGIHSIFDYISVILYLDIMWLLCLFHLCYRELDGIVCMAMLSTTQMRRYSLCCTLVIISI